MELRRKQANFSIAQKERADGDCKKMRWRMGFGEIRECSKKELFLEKKRSIGIQCTDQPNHANVAYYCTYSDEIPFVSRTKTRGDEHMGSSHNEHGEIGTMCAMITPATGRCVSKMR